MPYGTVQVMTQLKGGYSEVLNSIPRRGSTGRAMGEYLMCCVACLSIALLWWRSARPPATQETCTSQKQHQG
jgi:hypothetical protein